MTTFQIDLLRPAEFAKTWRDWFVGPQAGKRLLYSYATVALAMVVVLLFVIPKRFTLEEDRETIKVLKQKVAQRQKDLADQRALYQGILELWRYEIHWSDVLRALSEFMPPDLRLRNVEFVEGAPNKQLLRLVLDTTLRPGGGNLVELDRLLNDLGRDPRFKKFSLQDWDVALSKEGGGGKQEHLVATVTFGVVP
jgi:hypothetical protein